MWATSPVLRLSIPKAASFPNSRSSKRSSTVKSAISHLKRSELMRLTLFCGVRRIEHLYDILLLANR